MRDWKLSAHCSPLILQQFDVEESVHNPLVAPHQTTGALAALSVCTQSTRSPYPAPALE